MTLKTLETYHKKNINDIIRNEEYKMQNIYKTLLDQKETIESHLTKARAGLESSSGTGAMIQEEYFQTVDLLEKMMDKFYELHMSNPLDERLKQKTQKIFEGSADIVKKLELLIDLQYQETPLIEDEKDMFADKITRISSRLRDTQYKAVTEDIQTLHDISEFMINRSHHIMASYEENLAKQGDCPEDDGSTTGSGPSKKRMLTLDELFDIPQDEIYGMFAGKKILSVIGGTEKNNSSFDPDARAYQHTNEPMYRLLEDLKLNLEGKTVLSITCSGDPAGFFAALGAERMVCFDTSYKATLYGEFKSACIKKLSFAQYRTFFSITSRDDEKEPEMSGAKKEASYSKDIVPILSEAARNSFDKLFHASGSDSSAYKVINDSRFFRNWGFASPAVESNLFSQSEKYYDIAQENLNKNNLIFIPGGLKELFDKVESKSSFDAVYVSNAPDHFKNSEGEVIPSEEIVTPFYKMLDGILRGSGSQIIFNFQWDYRAVPGSQKALKKLGYRLSLTDTDNYGCGKMAIAEKI